MHRVSIGPQPILFGEWVDMGLMLTKCGLEEKKFQGLSENACEQVVI